MFYTNFFHRTEEFFERFERQISTFALVAGFIFDNLTLQRIDSLFDHVIIVSYLLISGGSIALLNYYHEYPPKKDFSVWTQGVLPFLIQFAFGGLFSVFFVFYVRSANLSSSWLFLVILMSLLIGNEFFKGYYERLTFQVSIYFVAILSFLALIVPVLLKKMSAPIFVLSGALSLCIIYLFSWALFKVVPKRYEDSRRNLRNSIGIIFVVVNILYFTNLIPPVPLVLKDSGVYYYIERAGDNYRTLGVKKEWYQSLLFFPPETISLERSLPLYIFSSVFAPTDLNTRIVHDWQHYDEETGRWVSVSKITFPIFGGRNEGYRGFSVKENLEVGRWRVDIKTERNQIIGRVIFNVKEGVPEAELVERIL